MYVRAIGKDITYLIDNLKSCNRITWFYPVTDKCKNSIVLYFKKRRKLKIFQIWNF